MTAEDLPASDGIAEAMTEGALREIIPVIENTLFRKNVEILQLRIVVETLKETLGGERNEIKTFELIRRADESGVSGTGRVLEGVVFSDGTTVIRWTVPNGPNSTAIYGSFDEFKSIHIDSHPSNKSEIVWGEN